MSGALLSALPQLVAAAQEIPALVALAEQGAAELSALIQSGAASVASETALATSIEQAAAAGVAAQGN